MGWPLLQFLHPEDALPAFDAASPSGSEGFNIVPRDTVSLLTTLHLAEKVTVACLILACLAEAACRGPRRGPRGLHHYVRYLFVVGAKTVRAGVRSAVRESEALMDYLAYRYPDRHPRA
jgi:hypothetical protein